MRTVLSTIAGAAVGFSIPFIWLGGYLLVSVIGLCIGAIVGAVADRMDKR